MVIARIAAAVLVVAGQPGGDLLSDLQQAVARDDREAVAALIRYPIVVTAGEVRIPIANAAALVDGYDAVFTPELKEAIRSGTAVRDRLIRVSDGPGAARIAAITLPAARAASGDPARVVPGSTARPAQLSGALEPGGTDVYVAYVDKGRLLDVRILRVRGRDVVLRVLHGKTGAPVGSQPAAGSRVWIGRVPESADYAIEVRRTARGADAALPYVLVVTRR